MFSFKAFDCLFSVDRKLCYILFCLFDVPVDVVLDTIENG